MPDTKQVVIIYFHANPCTRRMTALPTPGAVSAQQAPAEEAGKSVFTEVSCDACFFGLSQLCSLPKDEACATFRPQWMVQARSGFPR